MSQEVDAILRDWHFSFLNHFSKKRRDLKLIVSERSRAQVNNSSLPEKSQKKATPTHKYEEWKNIAED